MAVSDHQKQWNSMVSGLPQEAYGSGLQLPLAGAGTGDPLFDSNYQEARDNAEFYRNQLEMLREEVDDQNTRTSQHYEEKIGTLSERVEHLQNLLTQENFRVERLNGELEMANSQLNEAHMNEANLENMVNELKAALKRKPTYSTSEGAQTPGSTDMPLIQAHVVDTQRSAVPPSLINGESNEEVAAAPAEQSAQALLDSIKNYFLMNQEAYDAIKNTPLASGGQLDIFANRQQEQYASAPFSPEGNSTYFSQPRVQKYLTTPDQSMNSIFNSQTHVENFNVAKLSEELQERIEALQQQLEEETGYRDDLELESQEMRNRIANLTRQVRRQRDEHEEEMLEKDQAHLKKVRELTDTVEDLGKEKALLEKRCADLQNKLDDLRRTPELSDEEEGKAT
ncbi:unnamed protein product [Dibothriocephalus latus]|uniref:Uncharacterized protein n=1 Tax=Dibothriocephalus latus TaxID=60516 RepID=A0A3P6QA21_DIBLA|nr:unnamed protein product [Dibothriocephalus latus]